MLHEEHYANRAKDIFSTFSAALQNAPATAPQMLAALQFSRSKPRQAVIAGDPQQQATRLLVHSILRDFHPDLVVLYARDANALSGDAAKPSPPCDPSRESLLSTSAKTLPAARLSLRRRTRAGCSIAFRTRIWIKIFDPSPAAMARPIFPALVPLARVIEKLTDCIGAKYPLMKRSTGFDQNPCRHPGEVSSCKLKADIALPLQSSARKANPHSPPRSLHFPAAFVPVRLLEQSGYFSANSLLASFSSAVRVSSASFAWVLPRQGFLPNGDPCS